MNATTTKTSDPDQPSLAILAGAPAGVRLYLSQLAKLAGWKTGEDEAEAKVSVRVDKGGLLFDHQGAQTLIAVPVRAAKILRYLQAAQNGTGMLADKISIGPCTLMPQESLIIDTAGQAVRLTEKETAILMCLSRANGKPVSRQSLLDDVWGYAQGVETHTLETHIYRLRQKIEINPATPDYLLTLEEGYALKL